MLARMEMKALFSTILPHLRNLAITGTPKLVESSFVSGLKTLPISYDLV
jgi:cytochrome P450